MTTNPSIQNNRRALYWIAGIILAVLIAFVVVYQRGGQEPGEGATKIGASLALTGSFPYWSQQIKHGLDLSLAHATADNPDGVPVILYEDNQGEPKNAVNAFRKLATVDRVAAVVTTHSHIAKAQRPLAGELSVPLLATVVSAVNFGLENPWSFLDWPSHQTITPPIAKYVYEQQGARKGATFVINDSYGTDGAKVFAEAFSALGGETVAAETMTSDETDFRDQSTKIVAAGPDVLYMVGRDAALANAVRQVRQAGFTGQIVGVNAFDSPIVWDTLGEMAEGIIFANFYMDPNSESASRFYDDYRSKHGQEADWIAFYGYSIGQYLFAIAREADNDPDKIRAALAALDVETIRGKLIMNQAREVEQSGALYLRKDGKNVLIEAAGQ